MPKYIAKKTLLHSNPIEMDERPSLLPQSPSRGGEITPTVGGIRGGDLSPLHHFPVRVIFGVLGVITPTLGVDVHP